MFKLILLTGLLFVGQLAFAQPANDGCAGATTLPQNGSCISGTTIAATDGLAGTAGCAANNDEVWFTFTATGTQANIVVTNGTMGGNVEVVILQATGACSGLSLSGSNCGASVLNSTFSNLQVGAIVYVLVSSTGADGTFSICNTVTSPPPVPGQDCTNPAILCNNNSFSQGSFTGIGASENISTNTCFGSQERQSRWYAFTIGCTGTLGFIITPVTASNDIDWVLTARSPTTCYSSGAIINTGEVSCNWSGCPGATGITSVANPCTTFGAADCGGMPGCQAGGIVTTVPTLTAGTTYTMLIDNFTTSGNGFSVDFSGSAIMGPSAAFTYIQSVDCFTITPTKTCATTNSTYSWSFGDGFTSTAQVPGPHTYSTSGNYLLSLTVTDALGCVRTISQTVNVGCIPLPVELGSFNSERFERHTELNWKLKSEKNNNYFTLERSLDGETWTTISTQQSIGDHTTGSEYAYKDDNSSLFMEQTLYYRLWQTDNDGTTTMLGISTLSGINGFSENINLVVSPNPSENVDAQLNIVSKYQEVGTLTVRDAFGKTILTKEIIASKGVNSYPIESASWNKGVYFIEFSTGADRSSTRMMKL